MINDIVGEKEIAQMLAVQQGTVHRWRARGLLPVPDGHVSGAPAWQWPTISAWADETGRSPRIRDHILFILAASPNGAGFATPITRALVRQGTVGDEASPARIASVLTDLLEEGLVSIHLNNEWRVTDQGRAAIADLPGRADLEHIRDLYATTKSLLVGQSVGFYTERRYRSVLRAYAEALIEAGSLQPSDSERLNVAVEAVRAAEALPWSPSAVPLVDAAYSNLQQLVDRMERDASQPDG